MGVSLGFSYSLTFDNMHYRFLLSLSLWSAFASANADTTQWIRINQLGYLPKGIKAAVWCSKETATVDSFTLVAFPSGKTVFQAAASKTFGNYGPFQQTARLNFSDFHTAGQYQLKVGRSLSPPFTISNTVYTGAADFCLRYMRQQRSGFNPYLRDSCHTRDGYTLYGPMPDSSFVDVSGGWHDASDYLQYVTTSANAAYHLLMAVRDYPQVFGDAFEANGLPGKNNLADVYDEAKWGLDWLLKMHPRADWMFGQLADDRDHISMRLPGLDSQYNRGYERPVYFLNGTPQQRGKYLNNTTGTSSVAAKFASAFALGAKLSRDQNYKDLLNTKAATALAFAEKKPGVAQTASVRSPYIYAEENWKDDMELAMAALGKRNEAMRYARDEPFTPWIGTDTAAHYQWYPFINLGHYELAKQVQTDQRRELIGYYATGIKKLWEKAEQNAFYRGVPFIWCSNNLAVSFAIQCRWYRQLSGDDQFAELEQACFDWIFGCNPWGTSMVYGLPAQGDTPTDPHSSFTHLGKYPIDGGLVDGPVYTSIFKSLIGLTLHEPDEYAAFQSDLAMYHDDYGDYSSNEPTVDGTASLVYLMAAYEAEGAVPKAITRGDSSTKKIAIVFTGHDYANSATAILNTLQKEKVKASFFLTGDFYRNPTNRALLKQLNKNGYYLGPHGDKHLLYADWKKRDSLLITKSDFNKDLQQNLVAMAKCGIDTSTAKYFLPSYEWYNDSIASWTQALGHQLVNYTAGTLSHADYTADSAKNFRDNETIYRSIIAKEESEGLNGNILLLHIGAGKARKQPFHLRLQELLATLKSKGYSLIRIDDLLH